MVSFLRVPYAVALERGMVQRRILVESTAGCSRLDEVDLLAADGRVRKNLVPLEPG
jgi:kynurenine 3-monooxygenase